ncbi:MAG: hypothetical protein M3Y32_01835 [Pseudomonadota bacterium]|nr:hypothetical protein [Pseudomonadota bacterium]
MKNTLITRSFSFAFAAVMSLAMLGGIDRLSQPETPAAGAAQWAQGVSASHA